MGVRSLKSFIEKQEELFVIDYKLHDTAIIIDASNLISALFRQSQKHERRDLFGGDMVQFGDYVSKFFDRLKRCNIEPILVLDGAQTYDGNKSKTAEKHRRALDRLQSCLSISKSGFGDFILPASATNVFRSIAHVKGLKLIQCMYEADLEVARIANELKCPVISNDSDFFLMNLPFGLVTIDLFEHDQVKQQLLTSELPLSTGSCGENISIHYIECHLFKQEFFANYVPSLRIETLPLLGVLAGNDFVAERVFEKICDRLPTASVQHLSIRQFRKVHHKNNKRQDKIVRILYFLCDKTLNEAVNQVCQQVAKDKRVKLKALIQANLNAYSIPLEDSFKSDLARLYRRGFYATHRDVQAKNKHLDEEFNLTIDTLVAWLRRAMEQSVLSYRCLEILNKNTIFMISNMDDPQLPSAHICQRRPMQVLLSLTRQAPSDNRLLFVYDRDGYEYKKHSICPLRELEGFGLLPSTFYDVPSIPAGDRRKILSATFHFSEQFFDENVGEYYDWFFDSRKAEEFLVIKLLMDYIDFESKEAKLWKHFRQATLLCMSHYFFKIESTADARGDSFSKLGKQDQEFFASLAKLIENQRFCKTPTLSKKRRYNCRLMHQITQLQSTIVSFNWLNAFLGDLITRVRSENWLNSCIIYNIAEGLHNKILRLDGETPILIHNLPRLDKTPKFKQTNSDPILDALLKLEIR